MTLRPCLDCYRLTPDSRCPEHRGARQRQRDHDRRLDPMRVLRRSAAWRRLSEQARAEQPWCTDCGTTEDLTGDHIVSPLQGGAPLDPANVTTRCRRCQNRKRDREGRRVL